MLVGVAFLPPSFPPSRTQAFYIIKWQNCLNICNRVYIREFETGSLKPKTQFEPSDCWIRLFLSLSIESKKSKYTSLFRFSEDSHVDLFFDVTLLHHYWSYCVLCLSRKVVLCGCFFLCIFSLVDHWIAGRKY